MNHESSYKSSVFLWENLESNHQNRWFVYSLTWEQSEDEPCDARHNYRLRDSDEPASFLAEEAPEGDGAGEAGEVDEDGGGEGLRIG